MEIGLYPTPGIENIRSTSFYGLTFVRVTFKYGVDFYFAYTQTGLSLQQNMSLPANQIPQIQQSSLVGEIFRYQIVGPPHFGLTSLRTVQDWIVLRRLFSVPGVVQVSSWDGTTKQYNVNVDLNKLDAYGITLQQIMSALSNANVNVGGREITVGQQSVNIRGVGLIDSGGADDVTKGYHTEDIEDLAKVEVGFVPRLGIAGKDDDDDVALSIVVMNRVLHTNDVLPKVEADVEKMNQDGTLPPGVKLVPYYDRASLVSVTKLAVRCRARIAISIQVDLDFAHLLSTNFAILLSFAPCRNPINAPPGRPSSTIAPPSLPNAPTACSSFAPTLARLRSSSRSGLR